MRHGTRKPHGPVLPATLWVEPGVGDIGEPRELFLIQFPKHAPAALRYLEGNLLPVYEDQYRRWVGAGASPHPPALMPWPDELQAIGQKWGETFHLLAPRYVLTRDICFEGSQYYDEVVFHAGETVPEGVPVSEHDMRAVGDGLPDWIQVQLRSTLADWLRFPKWAGKQWLMVEGYEHSDTGMLPATHDRASELIPAYQAALERNEQRLLKRKFKLESEPNWELMARQEDLRRSPMLAGLREKGCFERYRKPTVRHYEWAVQFQVAGRRIRDIDDEDESVTDRNVRTAVNNVLKAVGLPRRRDTRRSRR
jgi:hypothetical protein